MDNGNLNTTNTTQQCSSVTLGTSSTVFDSVLATFGFSITLKRLWLMLQTKNIDLLQLNLLIFNILNNVGLLVDLIINYTAPASAATSRVVLLGFILTGGSLVLCCICIERYIAVVHPIQYQQLKTKKIKEIVCATSWIITLSVPQCWENNICLTFKLIASIFLMAVLVMIWCNSKILRALKKSGPGRDEMHPIKVKAFNRVRSISLIILVFFLPAAVVATILAGCEEIGETMCLLIPLCILLCSCSCIVHPAFKLFVKGRRCTEKLIMNCKK